jgi:hypothetical protein
MTLQKQALRQIFSALLLEFYPPADRNDRQDLPTRCRAG